MVDWRGRKPCKHRYECVSQGKEAAAARGEEYAGLVTEVCSACEQYEPDAPQGYTRAKFF